MSNVAHPMAIDSKELFDEYDSIPRYVWTTDGQQIFVQSVPKTMNSIMKRGNKNSPNNMPSNRIKPYDNVNVPNTIIVQSLQVLE